MAIKRKTLVTISIVVIATVIALAWWYTGESKPRAGVDSTSMLKGLAAPQE